jgi:hypothetical protein
MSLGSESKPQRPSQSSPLLPAMWDQAVSTKRLLKPSSRPQNPGVACQPAMGQGIGIPDSSSQVWPQQYQCLQCPSISTLSTRKMRPASAQPIRTESEKSYDRGNGGDLIYSRSENIFPGPPLCGGKSKSSTSPRYSVKFVPKRLGQRAPSPPPQYRRLCTMSLCKK